MSPDIVLWLFVLFFIKHFLCDFPLQSFPYMYKNKGTYGHMGGILHAGIHAAATALILSPFVGIKLGLVGAAIDGWVHYHIDWAKMRINASTGWTPTNSDNFWVLLGLDQLLHYLTYAGIIYLLFLSHH